MRMIVSASALLLGFAAACNGEVVGGGQRPARVDVLSGDLQADTVGKELAQPLVVRVVDDRDRPVRNQLVNFVVTAGGGSVFAGAAITNADGEARERWTLGTVAGDTQRVEARAVDPATGQAIVFATFRAIGVPDAPVAASAVGATARTGAAGTAVADSLVIRVVDRYGNGVPGVAVTFAAASGGSVSPATAVTRADGTARAQWTLGPATGQQTATATAAGFPPVTFTAQAAVGAAARVAFVPDSIRFTALDQTVIIRVTAFDAFDNPIPGLQATVVNENEAVVDLAYGPGSFVRSRSNGTTRLTVTVAGSTAADTMPITVRQAVATLSAPETIVAQIGTTFRVGALARDPGGRPVTDAVYTYASSSTNLTVTPAGMVTAVGTPGGTITTRVGDRTVVTQVVVLDRLDEVSSISTGDTHACAVGGHYTVMGFYCWGLNTSGQLQNGQTAGPDPCRGTSSGCYQKAVLVPNGGSEVVAGSEQTCVIADLVGPVYCTGADHRLALVPGGLRFTVLGRGSQPHCALVLDGQAYCGLSAAAAPVKVPGQQQAFHDISSSRDHTCALDYDGRAYCWGSNAAGQLGDGTTTASATPVLVSGDLRFRSIAAGDGVSGAGFTCAITAFGGDAYCWGDNGFGQLGNGSTTSSSVPAKVAGGREWRFVTAGKARTCAVAGQNVFCWGVQRVGAGAVTHSSTTPVQVEEMRVSAIAQATRVDAGFGFTCATTDERVARCWGSNPFGQLGNGTTTDSDTPTDVRRR